MGLMKWLNGSGTPAESQKLPDELRVPFSGTKKEFELLCQKVWADAHLQSQRQLSLSLMHLAEHHADAALRCFKLRFKPVDSE